MFDHYPRFYPGISRYIWFREKTRERTRDDDEDREKRKRERSTQPDTEITKKPKTEKDDKLKQDLDTLIKREESKLKVRFIKLGCSKVVCVFPMVIWSEFRLGQYINNVHWKGAFHFTLYKSTFRVPWCPIPVALSPLDFTIFLWFPN